MVRALEVVGLDLDLGDLGFLEFGWGLGLGFVGLGFVGLGVEEEVCWRRKWATSLERTESEGMVDLRGGGWRQGWSGECLAAQLGSI